MYQQRIDEFKAKVLGLSTDDLKDLLNDDDKLDETIKEELKTLEDNKDALLIENRARAEENLAKEPTITELKESINQLSEEGKELFKLIQEKLAELKSKSGNTDVDTTLALLQTAAAECEEESEQIVKDLMQNSLTVEEFLEKFMDVRKKMHLRKIKAEKMTELIRKPPPSRNPGGMFSTSGYPRGPLYPSVNSVPYPLGPMPMPMPGQFF